MDLVVLTDRTSLRPMTPPAMDPRIWSRLPEDLLEHILSLLPLKTFLNLRSTCKHFRSLLFSPSFISRHSSSSPSSSSSPISSFLLLSHPQFHFQQLFPLYDTVLSTWRNLSLSLSSDLSCAILSSSSNGLLCFSLPNSSSLLVCNLLARSSRIVEFPTYPFAVELLTLVSTPIGYKIFILSSSRSSSNAFVYDSRVQSWHKFEQSDPILIGNFHQEGVHCNGFLYFTTLEPFAVVSFDLERGNWGRSTIEMPSGLAFARLISNGDGKLFLIGGIGRNGISKSMKLWKLSEEEEEEEEERKWIEIERVPEMMCRKFMSVCYHNYEHVNCFWHQGMICVWCYTWPEILYYKVSRRSWHWLPKCPSLPDKWSCGFRWFSFVPDLFALV